MNNAMTMDHEPGHGIDYYAMAPEDGAEAERTENHKPVKMIGKCPE